MFNQQQDFRAYYGQQTNLQIAMQNILAQHESRKQLID